MHMKSVTENSVTLKYKLRFLLSYLLSIQLFNDYFQEILQCVLLHIHQHRLGPVLNLEFQDFFGLGLGKVGKVIFHCRKQNLHISGVLCYAFPYKVCQIVLTQPKGSDDILLIFAGLYNLFKGYRFNVRMVLILIFFIPLDNFIEDFLIYNSTENSSATVLLEVTCFE